jgi:uncharacterized membrane protein
MSNLGPVGPHFSVVLNISCAFLPLLLSLWLFRSDRHRNIVWWGGVLVVVALLPTAPYTLTDIIHFIAAVRQQPLLPVRHIVLVLIPLYTLYMLTCFQAYVISLLLADNYLKKQGLNHWVLPLELILCFLSGIGIYLGRFQRLSSWDLVTEPTKVIVDLLHDFSLQSFMMFIGLTFIIVFGLYYVLKVIDVALWRTYVTPKRS